MARVGDAEHPEFADGEIMITQTAKDEPRTTIDLLIQGADIVCFDDSDSLMRNGAIAIKGDLIAWIGTSSEALERYTVRQTIDGRGMIAMPGFIDCHVHTAQQFLHGKLPSIRRRGELRSPMWQRYLIPFESCLEPEDVYCSGVAAYAAMIRSGTTCFLEAGGPFSDEMGRAADEIGIRGELRCRRWMRWRTSRLTRAWTQRLHFAKAKSWSSDGEGIHE